ncbi:MAG: AAA family ATPase [Gemmatimonadota bacterium]
MYRLQCFGSAVVLDDQGSEVHFRSRKHLGLLVYLCAHPNRAFSRRRLAELFWDTGEGLARHSLSQALYDIRRKLRAFEVQTRSGSLRLERNQIRYEALELEECLKSGDLSRSAELVRGEFAPNLVSLGSRAFQRWLEGEASRLKTLGQVALRRFIEECDRQGRWGELCLAALRLIKMNPLDESAHRSLMKALWLQGDQPSALQHYAEFEEFLLKELPGGPSTDTLRLVDRIRSSRAPALSLPAPGEAELPLVGRETEFEVLRTALGRIREQPGKVLVVMGEAGIGKTRLLQEVTRNAAMDGIRCLESRCYPAESDVAYGPVLDGIEPVARKIAESLRGGQHRYYQLGHLFPDLFTHSSEDEAEAIDPAVRRRRLFEEVTDLIRQTVRGAPVVWVVEDIHWIDAASASLLHYISRRLRDRPFLLVLSARSGTEIRETARRLMEESSDSLATESVELQPLSRDNIRQLLSSVGEGPSESSVISLAERFSGGNPFYALEILRAASSLSEQGELPPIGSFISDRLRSLLRFRLRGLSSHALRILEAVAVLERHATPRHVGVVAGLSAEEVVRTAEGLRTRHLLKDDGRRLEFGHDISREFVCSSLGLLQRAALHLTVGEVLATDPEVNPATLAHHFEQGGDRTRAYEYAMRAAERSVASSAHKEASSMAALAASVAKTEHEKLRALWVQAETEMAAGHFVVAESLFTRILDAFPTLSGVQAASAQLAVARARVESSNWPGARACLNRVTESIANLPDERQRHEKELERLALVLKIGILTHDEGEARQAYEAIRTLYESGTRSDALTPTAKAEALCSQVVYATFMESTEEARDLLGKKSWSDTDLPTPMRLRVLLSEVVVWIRLAEWDRAEAAIGKGLALAREKNDAVHCAHLHNNLSCLALEKGDWANAEHYAKESCRLYLALGIDRYSALPALLNLANAKFYSGHPKSAAQLYREALVVSRANGASYHLAELHASLGLVGLQVGDVASVIKHVAGLEQNKEALAAGYDRFKAEWFCAYLLRLCSVSEDVINSRLCQCAAEERKRDRVGHLKLLWLASLLGGNRDGDDGSSSLVSDLRQHGLDWFPAFTRRWLRIANANASRIPRASRRELSRSLVRSLDLDAAGIRLQPQ